MAVSNEKWCLWKTFVKWTDQPMSNAKILKLFSTVNTNIFFHSGPRCCAQSSVLIYSHVTWSKWMREAASTSHTQSRGLTDLFLGGLDGCRITYTCLFAFAGNATRGNKPTKPSQPAPAAPATAAAVAAPLKPGRIKGTLSMDFWLQGRKERSL